ncbi:glycosyltransferase family 2 protein [Cohnella luojiensis]|uniref:Glycosyltransferase family 2 protein n=1 Tax=Cohnella luojiensis TaxID=652876 RepID=A0A4Y8LYE1_9BACL|nr:glycosyltransferase family 2 protein [Cohnella luojiensis]TFE27272.1 glycosyltransferase family 2 protein [Cohnella luojiensis]
MSCKISVIIPAYNVEKYVKKAIESALNQTLKDIEVIVVDDCSTDETVNVIKSIYDTRLKLVQNQTNKGVSFSRNKAIEASSGEWIAIMDSDDWWSPERLQKMLNHAIENNANIVCDDLWLIHDGEEVPYTTHLKSRAKIIGHHKEMTFLSASRMISDDYGYLKPIIRSDLIKNTGLLYDENLNGDEDFKFLVECIYHSGKMLLIPEPMYYYRTRPNSLSSSISRAIVLHQSQIRFTGELITTYSQEPEIESALKSHRKKKQRGLAELLFKDRLEKKKYLSATILIASRPILIKSLLRNALIR